MAQKFLTVEFVQTDQQLLNMCLQLCNAVGLVKLDKPVASNTLYINENVRLRMSRRL